MSHCESMNDALDDAALGDSVNESLRIHLAQCCACTAELERRRALARRIDEAVVALANAQPASALPQRIGAQIRSASQKRTPNRVWPRIAIGAALAASIAGFVVGLRAVPPPAAHGHELSALSSWRSPTGALMESRGSVLVAPLRDTWFNAGPATSHPQPTPGVSHAT
jgi:anti-sigma factor RsiW